MKASHQGVYIWARGTQPGGAATPQTLLRSSPHQSTPERLEDLVRLAGASGWAPEGRHPAAPFLRQEPAHLVHQGRSTRRLEKEPTPGRGCDAFMPGADVRYVHRRQQGWATDDVGSVAWSTGRSKQRPGRPLLSGTFGPAGFAVAPVAGFGPGVAGTAGTTFEATRTACTYIGFFHAMYVHAPPARSKGKTAVFWARWLCRSQGR